MKKVGYDLGHKMQEEMPMPMTNMDKKKICYPNVHLSDKELPLLEELDVGDKVSFLCLFKIIDKMETEKECNYTLELQKVAEDSEMKMSKALEDFMGEHKEVETEEKDSEDETNEKD